MKPAKQDPFDNIPADIVDKDLFAALPVSLQQACARGEVELAELLERITAPDSDDLCPWCATRPIYSVTVGICLPCLRRRSTDLHLENVSQLEALRAYNVAKKRRQRGRDELGLSPGQAQALATIPQTAAEYGRVDILPSNASATLECRACGRRIPFRPDRELCNRCEDLASRRDAVRSRGE